MASFGLRNLPEIEVSQLHVWSGGIRIECNRLFKSRLSITEALLGSHIASPGHVHLRTLRRYLQCLLQIRFSLFGISLLERHVPPDLGEG